MDRAWESRTGSKEKISPVEAIKDFDHDQIVVCIANSDAQKSIRDNLVKLGEDESKTVLAGDN